MNEQELSRLIGLQKVLGEQFEADVAIINDPEKAKQLDSLNRDLLVTRANATQVLLGITQISIGVNINSMQREAPAAEAPAEGEKPVESVDEKPAEPASADEKETAEESPKQE